MMRKLIPFLCMLVMLAALCSVAAAAERQPLRVAQYPLVVQSSWQEPGLEVTDELEGRLTGLCTCRSTARCIAWSICRKRIAWLPGMRPRMTMLAETQGDGKSRGEKLDADLVVIPVINDYVQYTTMSWHWDRDIILHSYVSLELVVYDRATDKVVDKKASRFYDDDYSTTGTASYLAREAMTDLIQQVNLRGYIWDRPAMAQVPAGEAATQVPAGQGQAAAKK